MDYLKLTEFYERLEGTTKRLEKTEIVKELFQVTSKSDIEAVVHLIIGKVFTEISESKTGVNNKLVIKGLASTVGTTPEQVEKEWAKLGDLGNVAEKLVQNKKQTTLFSKKLTITKVFENTKKLASMEGKGSVERRIELMKELLSTATPKEAKYLVRLFLEDLRIGVGESVVRDAIVWSNYNVNYKNENLEVGSREEYNKLVDEVQKAYDLTNDFVAVLEVVKEKGFEGLKKLGLKPGIPINPMLAIKTDTAEEAANSVGLPCLIDYKLDGFRVQVHYDGKSIKLFTRRLENVTRQFPDVVETVSKFVKTKSFILDAEIMGINTKTQKYVPFQKISQRIKRKHNIQEMIKQLPVELNCFDIIYKDGESLINLTQKERREILIKTVPSHRPKITPTQGKIAKTVKEIEEFYKQSLAAGNEGIMIKNLNKKYTPGRKVEGWEKLKPVLENLDLVITKAEWGTGKRANSLSSFTVACKENSDYLELGKVSTGVKEKAEQGVSYNELTKLLKPLITKQHGKIVELKPKIVIEVGYEEIQKSVSYNSGYALRFPRFIHLRIERKESHINTIDDVKRIFKHQKAR